MEPNFYDLNGISPRCALEMMRYNSLSSFDEYCRYGMDFIDDKVRYHPFWLSQAAGHNCYEGDDNFRSKLKEINRLGIYTWVSQPSELSETFVQYPFVTGVMNKQKAQSLLRAIDNLSSDNLIYTTGDKTTFDPQKHSNLLVYNGSIKVSYNPGDDINVKGSWFYSDIVQSDKYIEYENALIMKLMSNLDPNYYCIVNFMDNRNNDDLFDIIIKLLETIQ